jgi:hypothetical protein
MKKLGNIFLIAIALHNVAHAGDLTAPNNNLKSYSLYIQPRFHTGTTDDRYSTVVQAQNPGQAIQIAYGMCGGKDNGCEVTFQGEVR